VILIFFKDREKDPRKFSKNVEKWKFFYKQFVKVAIFAKVFGKIWLEGIFYFLFKIFLGCFCHLSEVYPLRFDPGEPPLPPVGEWAQTQYTTASFFSNLYKVHCWYTAVCIFPILSYIWNFIWLCFFVTSNLDNLTVKFCKYLNKSADAC